MNECSFSVNYDKTVFILIHVRRAEGSRAQRLRMGLRTGSAVRCAGTAGLEPAGRASDSSERQHSDSRAVGGAPRGGRERERSGRSGGAVFLRHGSERDDGDGDGDVE
ncbi:hypothetical protein EVAR_77057_1 [Eumeta japonica]|uniref:Uncharacterized protein n=1 Tax=Eumeta variegata TaxID=151549 RepID=A0A4C2ACI2_EUMVA|nr:hypothetical protein EVAR_77057_1 [Eumeta japonica]